MALKNNETSLWLERFQRECHLKSEIILTGNTLDLVFSENLYAPVRDVIIKQLRKEGFENIIRWDPASGIDQSLDSKLPDDSESSLPASGQPYETGLENLVPSTAIQNDSRMKTRKSFFRMVHAAMSDNRQRTAVVIDFSDFIFGSSRGQQTDELDCLASLSKAVMESRNYETGGMRQNLIVFLLHRSANLPPDCYLHQPLVNVINIPLPNRDERECYVESNKAGFHLKEDIQHDKLKMDDLVDALEGLTLLDIAQIMKLSHLKRDEKLSITKLINLYRYGEKESPWEELSTEKLRTIQAKLKERVKGQDEAINKIRSVVLNAKTGLSGLNHSSSKRKPRGVLFFVGPTGVGKTELAKALAEFIFGDEQACIRFDMSEYSTENSDQRLIGAPPGYVGYEAGGQLTNAVKTKPFSVLLFDEIEKANPRILDKFLQILEDGRLTDGKGETVNFSETFIIFTSNIGASTVSDMKDPSVSAVKNHFISAVQNRFVKEMNRPELLNRLGNNIVVFNFINDPAIYRQIVQAKFQPYVTYIKERYHADVVMDNEDELIDELLSHLNTSNGGRGIMNDLEDRIGTALSEFIFERFDILEGRRIHIELIGGSFLPRLE